MVAETVTQRNQNETEAVDMFLRSGTRCCCFAHGLLDLGYMHIATKRCTSKHMVPTETINDIACSEQKAGLNAGMNDSKTSTNLAVMPEVVP